MSARYTDNGDTIVEPDGSFLCEHEMGDGPAPSARLVDPSTTAPVSCADCGTVYVCWTDGGRRLAKPVVMAG